MAKSLSILWSHNERKFPNWLASCVTASRSQGFIWWDVGWPINFDQFSPPVDGFIWNTVRGQVTHRALIEDVLCQPDRTKVDEIAQNWITLNLPVHENCPFVLIGQKGNVGTLTVLKLTDLEPLEKPKNLDAFILCNDKVPSVPPQKYYRVRLIA
jgi:hypothetical protein